MRRHPLLNRQSFLRRLAAKVLGADTIGYDPPMRTIASDVAIRVPFCYRPTISEGRRAVVVHLFHSDMASYFLELARHVPGSVDLLVSTDTAAKAGNIGNALRTWSSGTVDIRVVANRGRDIMPKFHTFAHDYRRYDQVLFLHSKKSLYLNGGGEDWLTVLIGSLIGTEDVVRSILAMYDADPRLGIVFPQHYEGIRDRLERAWGGNREAGGSLCRQMGISLADARALDFASGSMFWARPAALAPILDLRLQPGDFPDEAGQMDETLAHALERVLLLAAEKAGFTWLKTADPNFYPDDLLTLDVATEEDLPRKMQQADYRLLRW